MPSYPSLDNSFGALYIGATIAAILFGVTSLEAVIYFTRFPHDWWIHRYSVATLWILDALHVALSTHALYFYLVTHFGDFVTLGAPTWSFRLQLVIKMSIVLWVQVLYAIRLWKLGRHFPKTFPWLVFLGVAAVFGIGIFSLRDVYIAPTFADIDDVKAGIYTVFCVIPASDLVIAISMCYYLHQIRAATSYSNTIAFLLLLMRFILISGLATSACSLLSLITYAAWPDSFIFFAFDFILPKLYIISLLAMFNFRKDHQAKLLGADCDSEAPIVFRKVSANHETGTDETVRKFPHLAAWDK
ncbi:hypothetical protein EV421DRAFT_1910348 [Armillaria borealis]|uniref:DUF6534 domain-containing protein n=1 Tax=Armillaria borealis TaxID=47425 RepID=A0AA39J0E3_9AGAR|nr:hypothetical protein EV421DRAFT_1910348 [Armillaria borealis]